MKKILVLFFLAACGISSASSQLRVANNFGQILNVETGGKTIAIPNKEIAVFPARVRTATLSCQTTDNKIKFVISRKVSRSGLVEILASDSVGTTSASKQNFSNNIAIAATVSDEADAVIVPESEPSLEAILKGDVSEDSNKKTADISVSDLDVITKDTVSQSPSILEPIMIKYYGTFTLKIISDEGQGKELLGLSDSVDNSSPRTCILNVQKGADLLIKFVLKSDDHQQSIWPYGEIRKHINLEDSVCEITDFDVDALALYETKKVRFKVEAEDYKVILKPRKDKIISLGYQEVSKPVALPIGQSYIEAAYTDSKEQLHSQILLPIFVTSNGQKIRITAADLAKSLVVKNW